MENVIEIKASNKEIAITRALNILEAKESEIVKVEELKKPKSFFGFFAKDGLYRVEIKRENFEKDEEKIVEEKLEETLELEIEKSQLPEEKGDKKEEFILKTAQVLLDKMGLELEAEILRIDGRNCVVNLFGEDNGIIIGKKGKTLNSYEYLLNTLVKDIKIEVDVEGFKEKRNVTLRDLARKMAEKAIKTNKPIRLNPMPPRERKIIHEVVNKYAELDTYSEGKDPKRYIVIKRKK